MKNPTFRLIIHVSFCLLPALTGPIFAQNPLAHQPNYEKRYTFKVFPSTEELQSGAYLKIYDESFILKTNSIDAIAVEANVTLLPASELSKVRYRRIINSFQSPTDVQSSDYNAGLKDGRKVGQASATGGWFASGVIGGFYSGFMGLVSINREGKSAIVWTTSLGIFPFILSSYVGLEVPHSKMPKNTSPDFVAGFSKGYKDGKRSKQTGRTFRGFLVGAGIGIAAIILIARNIPSVKPAIYNP